METVKVLTGMFVIFLLLGLLGFGVHGSGAGGGGGDLDGGVDGGGCGDGDGDGGGDGE